jgi:F420H(2)-dependent quinone reductase
VSVFIPARKVRGRAAAGAAHDRLWARWAEIDDKVDGDAARRPGETAVVILEPVGSARRR